MEIANHDAASSRPEESVRRGLESDAGQITRLLREAPYTHIHADWHYPSQWLGTPSFVLLEDDTAAPRTLSHRLFTPPTPALACLAIAADPPPAAWVRVAAVARPSLAPHHLAALLAALLPALRQSGVRQIAWLMVEEWPGEWLAGIGFSQVNAVVTYIRPHAPLPPLTPNENLVIRPATAVDFPLLEQMEAAAFEPMWRHSAEGLALAGRQSLSFDVAELDGRVVGFQFSTPTRRGAHLSRMTVDPAYQRLGVGSALLAHALAGYERQGAGTVTLNTQADNLASQRLYERFGFRPNGERFPVWSLDL